MTSSANAVALLLSRDDATHLGLSVEPGFDQIHAEPHGQLCPVASSQQPASL
ncbi:hypothetical protein [Rufibacter latericius]|uniref:hypothetical protein n=1 Tax=Rufibacter latericius TaxID=2487040 RepID=UPI00140277FA|nr:hypothetical protein [Rufibacter latericius]